ncbi:MAG: cyclic nucleotide-binding domain-containing protein [Methylomonas sp.]|nr:cyclic nucleotide-binding domain-containing protein [Methylomonas sp.]
MPNANELQALLKQNILFAETGPDLLAVIAESVRLLTVKRGTVIFRASDAASGLYLIVDGSIQIFIEHHGERLILTHAAKGHLFGEFLLSGNGVRSTNAMALSDCDLLFWPIGAFGDLLAKHADAMTPIASRLIRRLSWNQSMRTLRQCEFFGGLNEEIARELLKQLELQSIPANTLLVKQHDPADAMYIVVNGQFEISKTDMAGQSQIIGSIGRGETVGEMGLLGSTPRSANAKALRDSIVARLNRDAFESLLRRYPVEINQTFVRSLIRHVDSGKKPVTAKIYALVNLSPQIDLQDFLRALEHALSNHGSVRMLSSAAVDQAFMRKGAAQSEFTDADNAGLVQWLAEQEVAHRHVVYIADDQLDAWSRRCLRQADHVLFLADGKDDPAIRSFESQILNEISAFPLKKNLILQHPQPATRPYGTSFWLSSRQLDAHYHVRQGWQNDFDRLARFMTGNALGLVLGGGAARGFAHIGVLKALKEFNIPVDLIGGNSMGAILAAEYALQWNEEHILEQTRQLCLQGDRFTLPLVSLFSGKTMTAALQALFDDVMIEDLWMPFFCVSCNISRARLMTHDQGSLLPALLASNAPPGLFPPQVSGGDLLVDGALLNNLPVDVMRTFNQGGRIIAVDVNQREDLLNNTDNVGGVSGWRVLLDSLRPVRHIHMPGIVQILTRSSMIGGLAQQKKMHEGLADLYLHPPVNTFPLTAYADAAAISETGYRYAKEQLALWLENPGAGIPLE